MEKPRGCAEHLEGDSQKLEIKGLQAPARASVPIGSDGQWAPVGGRKKEVKMAKMYNHPLNYIFSLCLADLTKKAGSIREELKHH